MNITELDRSLFTKPSMINAHTVIVLADGGHATTTFTTKEAADRWAYSQAVSEAAKMGFDVEDDAVFEDDALSFEDLIAGIGEGGQYSENRTDGNVGHVTIKILEGVLVA